MKINETKCKVSVIIPTYNVSKYIESTLKSVINQSFKEFELILVDDGSKDNTIDIAHDILSSSDIYYTIIKQENSGVSVARNVGIDAAKGEYIYILDSDDIINKDLLKKMVVSAEVNNSDIVFCGFDKVNESGETIENYTKLYEYIETKISGKEAVELMLREKIWICTISGMYKRELIEENNLRYTANCTNGEDQEFCLKNLINANVVSCVRESLAYYVQRQTSVSYSGSLKKFSALGSVRRLIKYFEENNADKELIKYLSDNKYQKEFFRNFNSILKYDTDSKFVDNVISNDKFLKQLKKYKSIEMSSKEIKFLIRYKLYLHSPELYIKVMSKIYK